MVAAGRGLVCLSRPSVVVSYSAGAQVWEESRPAELCGAALVVVVSASIASVPLRSLAG